jgi:hypothetical protein
MNMVLWRSSIKALAQLKVIMVVLVMTVIVAHSSSGLSQAQRLRPEQLDAASGVNSPNLPNNVPFPKVELLKPPLIGTNIRVNQDTTGQPQNETSIAINPVDLDNLVGGANDYRTGPTRCGFYSSPNSGDTWTDGTLPLVSGFAEAGDPGIAFDANGEAYYLCMNFNRDAQGNAMENTQFVFKSVNGGRNWGAAVLAAGSPMANFDDKGHIAVDNISSTAHRGNIYVAFTRFPQLTEEEIRFSRSTDGGASFAGCPVACADFPINDDNPGLVQGSNITVGADGAVYVAWADNNGGATSRIMIDKSTNGGVSFGALAGGVDHVIRTFSAIGNPDLTKVVRPLDRVNSFPVIKADPCHANRIYAVWAEDPAGADDSDIMFARSINGGNTWGAPIRVNDDNNPVGDFHSQFFPWMAVDPGTCKIHIVWYDDRDDPDRADGTPLVNLYYASSSTRGLFFGPNTRISTASSDPTVQFSPPFFGDYNGIDARDGEVFPFWTDSRTGEQDVMTTDLDIRRLAAH